MPFCPNCLRDIPSNECHSHCSQHPFANEASRLRARVAELEAILRRVDVYFQHTGKVGDLPVSVHALLPIAQPNPQKGMK